MSAFAGAVRLSPSSVGADWSGTMRGLGLVLCVEAAGGISTACACCGSTWLRATWNLAP